MQFVALLLLFLLTPLASLAQQFNAGFVQGLWYSQEPVFVDESVRIYVAIRNHTGSDLTGRVEFFANGEAIGRQNVSALDGRIIESWTDWKPNYGSHTISATLSRTELHTVGSSTRTVEVTSAVAEDIIFIDYDTDGDGVGNEVDKDDDGDGISDEVEKKNGTDPLVYTELPQSDNSATDEQDDQETPENTAAAEPTPETDYPAGLEQYLTPSPANTALTTISETIATTKRNLDTYRTERAAAQQAANDPLSIVVNDDGFGEITRSDTPDREIRTPDISEGSWIATLIAVVKNIANFVFTTILAALSLALGHPILLQILLLVLILVGVYYLAKKFGGRR